MNISHKKTCRGCIAHKRGYCDLEYDVKYYTDNNHIQSFGIPQEPCPKPLKIRDWISVLEDDGYIE